MFALPSRAVLRCARGVLLLYVLMLVSTLGLARAGGLAVQAVCSAQGTHWVEQAAPGLDITGVSGNDAHGSPCLFCLPLASPALQQPITLIHLRSTHEAPCAMPHTALLPSSHGTPPPVRAPPRD